MLIGVVGLNGAGKDTVAQYLAENYGFAHKDLGQEIRDELKHLGRNFLDRNEMIALANERRQRFGANYWCKRAIESVNSKDLVITSVRNPSEVEEIKSRGGIIAEVFADQKTRFERTVARVKNDPSAHGDVQSFDDFKAKEAKELESADPAKQQLLKCISMAEYRLNNNNSTKELYGGIEEMLAKLKSKRVI
jgi:dephospho-CoA kinase